MEEVVQKIQSLEQKVTSLEQSTTSLDTRTTVQESRTTAAETAYNLLVEATKSRTDQLETTIAMKNNDISLEIQNMKVKLDDWFKEARNDFRRWRRPEQPRLDSPSIGPSWTQSL